MLVLYVRYGNSSFVYFQQNPSTFITSIVHSIKLFLPFNMFRHIFIYLVVITGWCLRVLKVSVSVVLHLLDLIVTIAHLNNDLMLAKSSKCKCFSFCLKFGFSKACVCSKTGRQASVEKSIRKQSTELSFTTNKTKMMQKQHKTLDSNKLQ